VRARACARACVRARQGVLDAGLCASCLRSRAAVCARVAALACAAVAGHMTCALHQPAHMCACVRVCVLGGTPCTAVVLPPAGTATSAAAASGEFLWGAVGHLALLAARS
jgi:hypothetical protein